MIRWSKLRKLIPTKVKIKTGHVYEVVWVTKFEDDHCQLGEVRFDTRQILININQSDREAVHSFIHECFHAISEAYEIGLTETQIQKLEKSTYYLFKIIWPFNC